MQSSPNISTSLLFLVKKLKNMDLSIPTAIKTDKIITIAPKTLDPKVTIKSSFNKFFN